MKYSVLKLAHALCISSLIVYWDQAKIRCQLSVNERLSEIVIPC